MRQLIALTLLIFLLAGCASAQPRAIFSPLSQPVAEEQIAAPSPIQQTHTSHEMAEAESAHVQPTIAVQPMTNPSPYSAMPELRSSISPDAIYLPMLAPADAPRPHFAPSTTLSSAEETHDIFLPLVISIDQRVLDARARFDCSHVEVLDAQQCDALLLLYALTNGPAWTKSDGWLVDKNPCNWYGLDCPWPEYNKMKLLLLPNNNLNGRLPYELHQLPLTFLRLSNNHLSGSIPPTIAQMTDLEEIRLENNQLSGEIPLGIVELPRLRELNLAGNDELHFDTTVYTCADDLPIPRQECEALVAFYREMNGTEWTFSGNDLSRQAWLVEHNPCKWTRVTCEDGHISALELSSVQMAASISKHIASLSHLWLLSLAGNQLSGPVPIEIGNLEHLTYLNLSYNDETLCMPEALRSFVELNFTHGYYPPPGGYCP